MRIVEILSPIVKPLEISSPNASFLGILRRAARCLEGPGSHCECPGDVVKATLLLLQLLLLTVNCLVFTGQIPHEVDMGTL